MDMNINTILEPPPPRKPSPKPHVHLYHPFGGHTIWPRFPQTSGSSQAMPCFSSHSMIPRPRTVLEYIPITSASIQIRFGCQQGYQVRQLCFRGVLLYHAWLQDVMEYRSFHSKPQSKLLSREVVPLH